MQTIDISDRHVAAKIGTAMLAGVAAVALVANAIFVESFSSSRLLIVLLMLLSLHALSCPRLLFCREFALYAAFVGYLFVTLLWTPDAVLAMNTLFPAVDFLLILLLFGSLVTFQDPRAVLTGTLIGFFIGAGAYTYTQGFPFVRPEEFSYNAIAAIYLFGLFVTMTFALTTRSKALPLLISLLLLVHIAATTSIKTNLGVLLGTVGAGIVFFRQSLQILRRNGIHLVLAAGALAYIVTVNDAVLERVDAGIQRVSLGVDVLQAQEDIAGYSGFGERQQWMQEGLRGWAGNPLFGYGVEAFRKNYGITSHSTPVDLLYNSGAMGFSLFYAMFVSMAWRVFYTRRSGARSLRALMVAGIVCYLFVTLSATMFYQSFLAAFVAIGTALLRLSAEQTLPDPRDD